MPQKWFAAYVQMMPRLQAERDLEWIHRYRAAERMLEKTEHEQYIQQLRRSANAVHKRQSEIEALANLATIGIPVVQE